MYICLINIKSKYMKTLVHINENNIYSFMNTIEYGSNLIVYNNESFRKIMQDNLSVLCEILEPGALEEIPHADLDLIEGEYRQVLIPGTFNILYRIRGEEIPQLKECDFRVKDILDDAVISRAKSVRFDLDVRLHKYAARLAKKYGVRFGHDQGLQYFDGSVKELPVSVRIENAFNEGRENISFDAKETRIATVRQYTSTLNSILGKKFRCTLDKGIITVHFNALSRESEFISKLDKLFNEYPDVYQLKSIEQFKNSFIMDIDWEDIPVAHNVENKWPDLKELKQNPPTRDIDGLKQFYLPELESDPGHVKQLIEDEEDDF